jgi:GH43 family beta-xylosidase
MKKIVFQSLLFLLALTSTFLMGCKPLPEPGYNNPLILQRADPMIVKANDGTYYFIATAPEYDRIELRKAATINALADAEPLVVWRRHESGPMTHHIWAPELHRINNTWYIYFAAGHSDDRWKIRMFALSNQFDDPTQGEWVEEGQVETHRDAFALDATVFEHKGEYYYVWAESTETNVNSGLIISKMKNPVTLEGPQVVITEPEFEWERHMYNVNEGAAVIKRNGKIFITFSASATDHNYAMGLLWADENADLLLAESWNKLPEPVFYTNDSLKRFGPGHNQFTIAEDGKTDLLVYHARDYKEIEGHSLGDPNRHTRVRVLRWNENGFPDFGQQLND